MHFWGNVFYIFTLYGLIVAVTKDDWEKLSREKRTVLLLYGPFGIIQASLTMEKCKINQLLCD